MNGRLRIGKGLIGVDGIEERDGGKALLGWLGLAWLGPRDQNCALGFLALLET